MSRTSKKSQKATEKTLAHTFLDQANKPNKPFNYEPIYHANGVVKFDSVQEAKSTAYLAIGRLFRMGSRPTQDGDIEMYEKIKNIVMDAKEYLDIYDRN